MIVTFHTVYKVGENLGRVGGREWRLHPCLLKCNLIMEISWNGGKG